MIKFFKIILITIFFATNALAGSDGEIKLSKNDQPVKDCFEPLNRATFSFNQGLDKAVLNLLLRVIITCHHQLEKERNVITNLSNLITIPNNILQGDLKVAAINTGRLVINSTIGLLGIIDVANDMGFPKYEKEDYGQTCNWGVGPGCYIVLPVLGPSTIRDTAGSFINVMGGDLV